MLSRISLAPTSAPQMEARAQVRVRGAAVTWNLVQVHGLTVARPLTSAARLTLRQQEW